MIRKCSSCGKNNRIPAARLADQGRCGACQQALGPLAEPLDVDTEQFREIVEGASVPVLVDFWAEWCGPCKMAAPEVKRAAQEARGRALVLKVDTEAHPELAQRFGIRGIPNFMVFEDGSRVFEHAGLVRAEQMLRWLERTPPSRGRSAAQPKEA
jgi:thioredoxin 2